MTFLDEHVRVISGSHPQAGELYYIVAQDGTKVAGPFNFKDSALMGLASHPTCKVVKEVKP